MADLWAFLGNPHNQATLSWLGGGLVVLAGGTWAVIRFLVGIKQGDGAAPSPASIEVLADRGGIAGGRDISMRTSHGLSGPTVILLVLAVVGTVLLAGSLLGKRITAEHGLATGGDISGSTITIGPGGPAAPAAPRQKK